MTQWQLNKEITCIHVRVCPNQFLFSLTLNGVAIAMYTCIYNVSYCIHPLSRHGLLLSLQISLVVSEMLPHLEDVLFVGHSGVVVKLAEAGLRSAGQQQEIVEALLSAFHAESDRKCCVPLFLALTAYEVYSEHEEKMESDKDIARVRHYHLHLIYSTCIWNTLHTVRVRVYGILYIQYVYVYMEYSSYSTCTCIWNTLHTVRVRVYGILYIQYVYVYMEYSTYSTCTCIWNTLHTVRVHVYGILYCFVCVSRGLFTFKGR